MVKQLYIISFLLLSNTLVWAQPKLAAELQEIREVYKSITSIEYDAVYTSYIEGREEKIDENKGKVINEGQYTYQTFGKLEMLSTPGYSINISHDTKQIIYSPKVILEKSSPQQGVSIDSLLKHCSVKSITKINSYTNQMRMQPDDENNRYDIQYNTKTKLISKIVINYGGEIHYQSDDETVDVKGKPKMVIDLMNYKLNQPYPKTRFSRATYLKVEGNRYVLKGKWAGYQLLGDTSIKKN